MWGRGLIVALFDQGSLRMVHCVLVRVAGITAFNEMIVRVLNNYKGISNVLNTCDSPILPSYLISSDRHPNRPHVSTYHGPEGTPKNKLPIYNVSLPN